MRRALSLLALAALAACNLGPGVAPGEAVERIAVSGGSVVIAGPEAYCVDMRTSRPRTGFALLAACATVGGETYPRRSAILSAQVGEPGSAAVAGSETTLAGFLGTAEGAAAVGLTGTTIRDIGTRRNAVSLYLTRASAGPLRGTGANEWRAFTDVGDRLVTLTVRDIASEPLSAREGQSLLSNFVDAVRLSNAAQTGG